MPSKLWKYSSVAELGDDVLKVNQKERPTGNCDSGRDAWDDTPHNLSEAMNTARQGGHWPEGARELQKVSVNTDVGGDFEHEQLITSVTGFMPDVPALLNGEPECMYNIEDAPERNRYIRMAVNITCASTVSQKELYNRGRAIMAIVEDLSIQGYGVEIFAVSQAISGGADAQLEVKIKDAAEQWNPDIAAFMLSNSSILRKLFFRLIEDHEAITSRLGGSYGSPGNANWKEECDVYFPAMLGGHRAGGDYHSPESALETVKSKVQKHLDIAAG